MNTDLITGQEFLPVGERPHLDFYNPPPFPIPPKPWQGTTVHQLQPTFADWHTSPPPVRQLMDLGEGMAMPKAHTVTKPSPRPRPARTTRVPRTTIKEGPGSLSNILSRLRGLFGKKGFVDELKDTWNGLDPTHKVLTGLGGALAAGSMFNELRPESGHIGNLLGTVGGLGLAGYGLSGGNLQNLGPTLQHILAGGPKPTGSVSTGSPTTSQVDGAGPSAGLAGLEGLQRHPRLGHYFKNGVPDAQELIKTPDAQLKSDLLLLSPEQKALLKSQLAGFKPSFGQRLGAKAMGIDINAQKDRFNQLLG